MSLELSFLAGDRILLLDLAGQFEFATDMLSVIGEESWSLLIYLKMLLFFRSFAVYPLPNERENALPSIVAIDPLAPLVPLLRLRESVAIGRASRRRSEIGSPVSSQ